MPAVTVIPVVFPALAADVAKMLVTLGNVAVFPLGGRPGPNPAALPANIPHVIACSGFAGLITWDGASSLTLTITDKPFYIAASAIQSAFQGALNGTAI